MDPAVCTGRPAESGQRKKVQTDHQCEEKHSGGFKTSNGKKIIETVKKDGNQKGAGHVLPISGEIAANLHEFCHAVVVSHENTEDRMRGNRGHGTKQSSCDSGVKNIFDILQNGKTETDGYGIHDRVKQKVKGGMIPGVFFQEETFAEFF